MTDPEEYKLFPEQYVEKENEIDEEEAEAEAAYLIQLAEEEEGGELGEKDKEGNSSEDPKGVATEE